MNLAVLRLRTAAQAEALEEFETFTAVVEAGYGQGRRWTRRQAALLVDEGRAGEILELGTITAEAQKVATGLRRVRYTRVYVSSSGLVLDELAEALPTHLRRNLWSRVLHPGLLPPVTAEATYQAIHELRPELGKVLRGLLDEPRPEDMRLSGSALQAAAQEADTVRLAVDIAGIRRTEIGTPAAPDGQRSFLERLESLRVPEDPAIVHDSMRFLDFDRIDHPSGAVQFRHGPELLTLINVNRRPLETTTGADLIYVNETRESCVLVQYKTMERDVGPPSRLLYRPDAQMEKELERMREIPISGGDGTPAQWRLNPGCCFVKLCKPVTSLTVEPTQLVSGLYLPLEYWDALSESPQILGPRGGKVFSYDTVGRHISNELFVGLVRGGWIGSRGQTTIDLTDAVVSALDADRSVTIAAARTADP